MDPMTVAATGLAVVQTGVLSGIYFRLGKGQVKMEDHGRRLAKLEEKPPCSAR